jgi:hypothetical protein
VGFFRVPNVKATADWRWTTGDSPDVTAEAQIEIDLRADPPEYRISYKAEVQGQEQREDVEIRGRLIVTQPRYGGARYWFACARCGRQRRILYMYPSWGRHRFACRRCHGLRYHVHRESRPDRLIRKARKYRRRAGSVDGCEPWQKPKWMRWETFSRLVLAGRAAQEEGDMIMLGKLGAALVAIQGRHRR